MTLLLKITLSLSVITSLVAWKKLPIQQMHQNQSLVALSKGYKICPPEKQNSDFPTHMLLKKKVRTPHTNRQNLCKENTEVDGPNIPQIYERNI